MYTKDKPYNVIHAKVKSVSILSRTNLTVSFFPGRNISVIYTRDKPYCIIHARDKPYHIIHARDKLYPVIHGRDKPYHVIHMRHKSFTLQCHSFWHYQPWYEPDHKKTCLRGLRPAKVKLNRPALLQRLARGLKFWKMETRGIMLSKQWKQRRWSDCAFVVRIWLKQTWLIHDGADRKGQLECDMHTEWSVLQNHGNRYTKSRSDNSAFLSKSRPIRSNFSLFLWRWISTVTQ